MTKADSRELAGWDKLDNADRVFIRSLPPTLRQQAIYHLIIPYHPGRKPFVDQAVKLGSKLHLHAALMAEFQNMHDGGRPIADPSWFIA